VLVLERNNLAVALLQTDCLSVRMAVLFTIEQTDRYPAVRLTQLNPEIFSGGPNARDVYGSLKI
jgi:hypothetical protein